jgi:hypothetical protein
MRGVSRNSGSSARKEDIRRFYFLISGRANPASRSIIGTGRSTT